MFTIPQPDRSHELKLKGYSLTKGGKLGYFVDITNLNYLEIGCYDGVDLAVLAERFSDKRIFGIDPFISDGWLAPDLPKDSFLTEQKRTYITI